MTNETKNKEKLPSLTNDPVRSTDEFTLENLASNSSTVSLCQSNATVCPIIFDTIPTVFISNSRTVARSAAIFPVVVSRFACKIRLH